MTIDYVNVIRMPKLTEKQRQLMKEACLKIKDIGQGKKFLVVDSECIKRGHIGWKEI